MLVVFNNVLFSVLAHAITPDFREDFRAVRTNCHSVAGARSAAAR